MTSVGLGCPPSWSGLDRFPDEARRTRCTATLCLLLAQISGGSVSRGEQAGLTPKTHNESVFLNLSLSETRNSTGTLVKATHAVSQAHRMQVEAAVAAEAEQSRMF